MKLLVELLELLENQRSAAEETAYQMGHKNGLAGKKIDAQKVFGDMLKAYEIGFKHGDEAAKKARAPRLNTPFDPNRDDLYGRHFREL